MGDNKDGTTLPHFKNLEAPRSHKDDARVILTLQTLQLALLMTNKET